MVQTVQSGGSAGAVPAVLDVPVIMQRRFLWNSGSAADSAHRLVWWTSQFATETGFAVGCDERGFSAFLGHFSRSSFLQGCGRPCGHAGRPGVPGEAGRCHSFSSSTRCGSCVGTQK